MNKPIAEVLEAAQPEWLGHGWPENDCELRNVIERAVILKPSQAIQPASLRLHPRVAPASARSKAMARDLREPARAGRVGRGAGVVLSRRRVAAPLTTGHGPATFRA